MERIYSKRPSQIFKIRENSQNFFQFQIYVGLSLFIQGTRQLLGTGRGILRHFKTKRGSLSKLLQVCCDFNWCHL